MKRFFIKYLSLIFLLSVLFYLPVHASRGVDDEPDVQLDSYTLQEILFQKSEDPELLEDLVKGTVWTSGGRKKYNMSSSTEIMLQDDQLQMITNGFSEDDKQLIKRILKLSKKGEIHRISELNVKGRTMAEMNSETGETIELEK